MTKIIGNEDCFDLTYMTFDESRYESLFHSKAHAFLAKLKVISKVLSMSLSESIEQWNHEEEIVFINPLVTYCASPSRHCRERVRFGLRSKSKLLNTTSTKKIDENKTTNQGDLVYAMWEHGLVNIIVEVSYSLITIT
jgi:hypothetical protein